MLIMFGPLSLGIEIGCSSEQGNPLVTIVLGNVVICGHFAVQKITFPSSLDHLSSVFRVHFVSLIKRQ